MTPTVLDKQPATLRPAPILGLAALVALALAFVPWFGLLAVPFRLLVTIIHELSHGLVALLTGGHFERFVVFPNGAGVAYTAGGWRALIIPAGYLGAALFGAALIVLGRNARAGRVALAVIGGAVLLLALRYGLPSIFSAQSAIGMLTVVSGVALGGALLVAARRASEALMLFLLNLIAIEAGLTAFSDLFTLIGVTSGATDMTANDAQSMAAISGIPAVIWAVLWALLAAVVIGFALWRTWISRRP